ncbi:LapA family protein [Bacillus sp. 1P06AnD]|uniref:LapA family protein n=1 Tax=Bacillus sp. 1P06AnD TaxID=3132208 RepID=UPI00399FCF2A
MKTQWIYIFGLIGAIIVCVFAVLNVDAVKVNYVFGHAEWPLILIIIGSVAIGSLVAWSLSIRRISLLKRKIKQLEKGQTHILNSKNENDVRK